MKKMSKRERGLVIGLIGFLLIYVLYQYAFSPIREKKSGLSDKVSELESQVKDMDVLEGQYTRVKSQGEALKMDIKKMEVEKGFGVIDYQTLLTELGRNAKEYRADVIKFKRLEYKEKNNYWEVPFEVSVQGEYRDIILFTDSIYQMGKYFVMSQIDMKQVDLIPMTNDVNGEEGESETKVKPGFEWGPQFIEKLNDGSSFTPNSIAQGQQANQVPNETGQTNYMDYLNEVQSQVKSEQKIQLDLKFHYISLTKPDDAKEVEQGVLQ